MTPERGTDRRRGAERSRRRIVAAAGVLRVAAFSMAAFSLSAQSAPPSIPTFSNVTVHDPSVLRVGSTFYVFGSHLASARTTDWLRWSQITGDTNPLGGNALVPNPQTELQEALAWVGTGAAFWAPDVIQLADGRFYYYYCVGRLDAPRAALGIAVSDSITGPYTNLGVILRSGMWGLPSEDGTIYDPTRHPNTVDPDVFFDESGKLWMVYGSYSGGIFILELDAASGFPLPNQGYGKKLIGGNHARIEGAFMLYSPESRHYYLFLSFGGLDANGGYNIRVGRSRRPDGPFFDAAGNDLTNVAGAPGTLFDDASIAPFGVKMMGNWQFLPVAGEPAATTTGYRSPGHNSAYYDPATGKHLLIFHTRFVGRGEEHQVRVHQMYMNADGWLVAAPHQYAGESLTLQHRNQVPADYKLINHGKGISAAVNTSAVISLQPDGKVTGAASGTWTFSQDNEFAVVLNGLTYRGLFTTQWDNDNGSWVFAFSAVSRTGVSVWGSQVVTSKHPRTVALSGQTVLYGESFSFGIPAPIGSPRNAYSYSLVSGPSGLTVDRPTGAVSWRPSLIEVGRTYDVVVRALKTDPSDPDEVLYAFPLTVTSSTVVRRLDLEFSVAASGGLRDVDGQFTGVTARLPGTGAGLPELDPNMRVDTAAGVLELRTTRADFNGRVGLPTNSSPGFALSDLGFTGAEDFAATVTFRPLVGLQLIDQVGLYVGASSDAVTRAGTIVFGAPERYAVHSENGIDFGGRFFGFGFNGTDGMTVTITRETGAWRYYVDGVDWTPNSPAFLDGRGDLTAGVFAITPLNSNVKSVAIDAISVVVATSEPTP
jgi:arabinan endo-1,5-alpha-L-arabinosidase